MPIQFPNLSTCSATVVTMTSQAEEFLMPVLEEGDSVDMLFQHFHKEVTDFNMFHISIRK
jgi:hypothetical protein